MLRIQKLIFVFIIVTMAMGSAIARPSHNKTIELGTEQLPLVVKINPTQNEIVRDNAAREEKAASDRWTLILNGLLALATIILAVFTYLLWRSTDKLWKTANKQSEDMKESLAIAKESADATKGIVATMERNAKRQMRAYVSILAGSCVPQDRTTGWKYEIRMFIKNTGFTPAHAVNFSARAKIMPFPLPDDIDLSLPASSNEAAGHITFGQQFFIRAWLDELISNDEISEITLGNREKLYIYGTVYYKDIFGDQHKTNFCQWAMWDVAGNFSTMNTDRHNDAT